MLKKFQTQIPMNLSFFEQVGIFDSKIFNPQVFGKYMETVPRTKLNELLRSGVLRPRPEYAAMFPEQAGGNYAVLPITGRIGGEPAKYDGEQNMPVSGLDTYLQGMIVAGFMKGWEEKDFTQSITGKDFMVEIARQVGEYWDDFDQRTLIAILTGVFAMTGANNLPFVTSHTTDTSALAGDAANFNETTLNTAAQKASGDNKNLFTMIIMHSFVATNLENKNLLERLKYTDANGIQRDLNLGTLNGRTVLIDDSMPVSGGNYTSYLLGNGAISYADVGVKVPYEVWRDPKEKGGLDQLLTRQRKLFAPFGISFTMAAMGTKSPGLSELAMGTNWEVVQNAGKTATIDIKAIPLARIIPKA
jgi:hypothetical protein